MPATNAYADLLPLIIADLPQCPTNTMVQALREAVREFCLESEAWIEPFQPMDVVGGQLAYVLNPPYVGEIRRVVEVWFANAAEVTAGSKGRKLEPEYYHFEQPETLRIKSMFVPSGNTTAGLNISAALAPFMLSDDSALNWPGFVNIYALAICHRSRMQLMLMPGKPWSNAALGRYFETQYGKEVGKAKAEIERRYTDARPYVIA